MSRIRIAPLAEHDLVEIWYFIAQDDPVAADRLLYLLEEKYKLLADNPHMGPARPDISKELRYHPVGNYLLALAGHDPSVTAPEWLPAADIRFVQ